MSQTTWLLRLLIYSALFERFSPFALTLPGRAPISFSSSALENTCSHTERAKDHCVAATISRRNQYPEAQLSPAVAGKDFFSIPG